MTDVVVPPAGLSEGERLIDTFVAPSKTFADIRRRTSWWLPFVVMVLASLLFTYAVDKKVGFDSIAQHQIEKSKFADRINSLPPEQRAAQMQAAAKRTRMFTYLAPVFILMFALVVSLLWWLTTNFALGANTTFPQIFAIWMYSALPKVIMSVLAAVLLFAGVGVDSFDIQNPIGTNVGYYLPDSSAVLKAAGSFIDVFGLWTMFLAVMGISIVANKTKGQAAVVVFGWWVVGMLLTVAMAAMFG